MWWWASDGEGHEDEDKEQEKEVSLSGNYQVLVSLSGTYRMLAKVITTSLADNDSICLVYSYIGRGVPQVPTLILPLSLITVFLCCFPL